MNKLIEKSPAMGASNILQFNKYTKKSKRTHELELTNCYNMFPELLQTVKTFEELVKTPEYEYYLDKMDIMAQMDRRFR